MGSSGIRKWCNSRQLQIMSFSVEVLLWFLVSICWLQSAWLDFNTLSLFLCRPLPCWRLIFLELYLKYSCKTLHFKNLFCKVVEPFIRRELMNCSVLQARFLKDLSAIAKEIEESDAFGNPTRCLTASVDALIHLFQVVCLRFSYSLLENWSGRLSLYCCSH